MIYCVSWNSTFFLQTSWFECNFAKLLDEDCSYSRYWSAVLDLRNDVNQYWKSNFKFNTCWTEKMTCLEDTESPCTSRMPETFATVQPLLHSNLSVPAPQRTCVIQCIMNELFFCLFASSGCFVYMLTLYDVCRVLWRLSLDSWGEILRSKVSVRLQSGAARGGAVFHSGACHLQNFLLVPPIMFVCHSRHACPLQIIRLLLPSHPRLLYTTSPAAFFTLTAALALRGQCIHRAAAGWDKNRVYFPPLNTFQPFS